MRRWGVVATVVMALLSASSALAATTPPPTLGLASIAPGGSGFGHVRPRTISAGGDPTGMVVNVKWSSWGGARAVGHGKADWVWPGWCVACGSVELPATVVAFGRTSCRGHFIYSYLEWYFPSRGMSFNRRLAGENLCTGHGSPPPAPAARCGRVNLHGAVAVHLTVYGLPRSCAAARRFVAHSGVARYLGRDARFTVHHWWCGSELSMSFGLPQSVSCERGDFANLTFQLKRAG
jgi:hypothetical protein